MLQYMCMECCIVSHWVVVCCFFKRKTAYEMRISDWSSDVCSSDLVTASADSGRPAPRPACRAGACPSPAASTHPITICSTASPETPARDSAALTAAEPSSVALHDDSAP